VSYSVNKARPSGWGLSPTHLKFFLLLPINAQVSECAAFHLKRLTGAIASEERISGNQFIAFEGKTRNQAYDRELQRN
jgi:hypothetical protein